MISFVLGNGKSRLSINPMELKSHGILYACNAAYRDFVPDHLIAVDKKMVDELVENNVNNMTIWTKEKFQTGRIKSLPIHLGWSSGPSALWLASQHSHTIYIIGFDYTPSVEYNNVYADTRNYKKSSDMAIFSGNWKAQTLKCINDYPEINYIRVVDKYYFDDLGTAKNYSEMMIDDFLMDFSIKKHDF